ncbi:hypothetical protein ACYYLW_004629, partial [Escherichia coli]
FFSKIFCSYRRSVLQTLPDTVDNFTDLRSCIEKLTRLIEADTSTNKKGTSIATSAHFAAVRGILCVQCFLLMSPPPDRTNQLCNTIQAQAERSSLD